MVKKIKYTLVFVVGLCLLGCAAETIDTETYKESRLSAEVIEFERLLNQYSKNAHQNKRNVMTVTETNDFMKASKNLLLVNGLSTEELSALAKAGNESLIKQAMIAYVEFKKLNNPKK